MLLVQAWWSDRFLEGVVRYAKEHNWILDCEMGWTHRLPARWQGDGIIAYAGRDPEIIDFVRKSGVPVVDFSTFGNLFNAPKVMISNEAIAQAAVAHLVGLGFNHFGCIVSTLHPTERIRHRCFREAVKRHGGEFHPLPLRNLARRLASCRKPMALLTTSDQLAIEVIRTCQDEGYSVPEDFAVIGVNDTPILCELAPVPVTSVNPDFEANGYQAAALLDRLIDGDPPPEQPIIIPPKGVTARRSSDTLCLPDPDTARTWRFLREHFLSLNSVADATTALQLPRRKIQTRFRRFTGRTMVQELTRLKIEHAKTLLTHPQKKIEAIAHESGFSSRTYFIRAFRHATGMNPKVYRKESLNPPLPQ